MHMHGAAGLNLKSVIHFVLEKNMSQSSSTICLCDLIDFLFWEQSTLDSTKATFIFHPMSSLLKPCSYNVVSLKKVYNNDGNATSQVNLTTHLLGSRL